MIAYKVVEKGTRNCSNVAMFNSQSKDRYSRYFYIKKEFEEFVKKNPEYFPKYLCGTFVKEAPGSFGILCFKTYTDAQYFRNNYLNSLRNTTIVRVKGYNQKEEPTKVNGGCGGDGIFYIKEEDFDGISPPSGTVAFELVEVLE